LNAMGLAVFLLDSFSGRGITETSTSLARLSDASMLIDAYRALAAVGVAQRGAREGHRLRDQRRQVAVPGACRERADAEQRQEPHRASHTSSPR
ncbi:MAG TPA: hypothetical protein VEA38_13875, partial [Terriglobales bacterium]|nr:hypothetical protein [Terriglobales bacterium]